MRITLKLVGLIVAGIVLVLCIETYFSIRYEVALFKDELSRDAAQRARILDALITDVWRRSGEQRALQLIDEANLQGPSTVHWVWLDAGPGNPRQPRASTPRLEPVRAGQQVTFEERTDSGPGWLYTYVPAHVGTPRKGAIELAYSLDGIERFRRNSMIAAAVTGTILLVGSGLAIAILGVTVVGRPLEQLIEKTRRVGAGDLSTPLELPRHDELSELAAALNQMCRDLAQAHDEVQKETEARISALEQLRHADRLSTVGRLASGLAHELGTPMNVASVRAELIIGESPPPSADVEASARIIKAQVDKMAAIIRQLLDFARRRSPRKQVCDLGRLVAETADLLGALARERHVAITVGDGADPLLAEADSAQIQQVFTNLLVNAMQAMPRGGTITVSTSHGPERRQGAQTERAAAEEHGHGRRREFARIDVQDEGVGIPQDQLQRIFDPFFTTKGAGEGTGLGLSIVHEIVQDHGGWVEVKSVVERGSCFSVFLPLAGAGAGAAAAPKPSNAVPSAPIPTATA